MLLLGVVLDDEASRLMGIVRWSDGRMIGSDGQLVSWSEIQMVG